jgi:hypothetical protein
VSLIHSGTDIVFEMVRDLGEPTNNFLPFIYNEWLDYLKTNGDCFEHYLCFMNVEGLKNSLMYQGQDLNRNNKVTDDFTRPLNDDINTQIEFSKFIQVFKNHFF